MCTVELAGLNLIGQLVLALAYTGPPSEISGLGSSKVWRHRSTRIEILWTNPI